MTTIRPFDKEIDYPTLAASLNALDNGSRTEEVMRNLDNNEPSRRRLLAVKDGVIVGHLIYRQEGDRPQEFGFQIDCPNNSQEVEEELCHTFLEAITPQQPISLCIRVDEEREARVAFLQKQGFIEVWRFVISRLDVGAFDPCVCQKAAEQVAASEIVIRTYAELSDDPARDSKLDDLNLRLLKDMPNWDPATRFEEIRREGFQECPGFLPDAWFIALDQDRYVGVSGLNRPGEIKPEEKEYLFTGMTGTLAEYRGCGIASTLKLRAALYAKENQIPEIRTWGANRAMQAINAKMGFVQEKPGWVMLKKDLQAASEPLAPPVEG
jgi:GNAT superfamily N-acetyltransferase